MNIQDLILLALVAGIALAARAGLKKREAEGKAGCGGCLAGGTCDACKKRDTR